METKKLFRRLTATAMAALMLTSSMSLTTNAAQSDSVSVSSTVSYSGTCGENVNWALYDDGTLVISGSGKMTDFYASESGPAPWYEHSEMITTVVVENGVTTLGDYAFRDCINSDVCGKAY